MIHDPCIFPQQRSVRRERDDWFLVQVGCFNSDGNTGGGSAGDFDDSYNQAMGYTDRTKASNPFGSTSDRTIGSSNATVGGDDDLFVGDEIDYGQAPNVGGGGAGDDNEESLADRINKFGVNRRNVSTVDPETVRAANAANIFDQITGGRQQQITGPDLTNAKVMSETVLGDVDLFDSIDSLPPVDLDEIPGGAVAAGTPAGTQLQAVGRHAFRGARPELRGSGAQTVDDTTVPTAQSMAGVNQSRPITDFDDVTLPEGPGVPKDTFVQNTTPRTKEEEAMAADQAYFNERDLNKDGTVGLIENLMSRQAFGLVGKASDLERKANIGNPMAGMDYEGEAYGTPDSIFESERGDNNNEVSAVPDVPPGPTGCPDGYEFNSETGSCEYKGVSYAGIGQGQGTVNLGPYTPATQYTGIAGLEPFVLRPTPGTLDLTPKYRFPDTST